MASKKFSRGSGSPLARFPDLRIFQSMTKNAVHAIQNNIHETAVKAPHRAFVERMVIVVRRLCNLVNDMIFTKFNQWLQAPYAL
ncbi:MAG TPA: hypothetical protein PLA50_16585 [Bacteroidia bacterium]|nr:hypothetical protein [Bacteroidia bacterium]